MDQQPLRFGPELRRLRLAAGYSLSRLSTLAHYSKSHLSKVERGLKPPSRTLARLCDTALRAHGALAELASEGLPAPGDTSQDPPASDEGEAWLMHLPAEGPSWFQPVRRRTLVAAGAASVTALGLGGQAAYAESGSLLTGARSLFDHYRRIGQFTNQELLLPALIAQTHSLRELATRTGPRTRKRLLRLASRYAEYVGWLTQENGDDRGSLWWTDCAVRLADAGDDPDLAVYALVRQALVTFYLDDHVRTVELSRRAQDAGPSPRIAGLAAQQEAQGHALAGDYDSCMRALDTARERLARPPGHSDDPDSPVIGTTHLSDPVSMITGWCLHDLGRPGQAAEILDREIAQLPDHAQRTQGRYGVRRALAYAQAGELDHACELSGQLLDSGTTVGSATIRVDLRRLAHALNRYPSHPAARDLRHRFASALHPAGA